MTVGEAMNATVDYAAKVGLAMIMVNCNLEQVCVVFFFTMCPHFVTCPISQYMLRVEQMKTALGGVMKVMAKSNINAMSMEGMGDIDSEYVALCLE